MATDCSQTDESSFEDALTDRFGGMTPCEFLSAIAERVADVQHAAPSPEALGIENQHEADVWVALLSLHARNSAARLLDMRRELTRKLDTTFPLDKTTRAIADEYGLDTFAPRMKVTQLPTARR